MRHYPLRQCLVKTDSNGSQYLEIPLQRPDMFAACDIEDAHLVTPFNWFARKSSRNLYVIRHSARINGKQVDIQLHRVILSGHPIVDHKDHNGLNNRRANLRPASNAQNIRNSRKAIVKNSKSSFKGVAPVMRSTTWRSSIHQGGKRIHIGCYATETQAAYAYDLKAKELFGEFACLNFP